MRLHEGHHGFARVAGAAHRLERDGFVFELFVEEDHLEPKLGLPRKCPGCGPLDGQIEHPEHVVGPAAYGLAKASRSVLPGVVIKVIIESAALMKDADDALCEKRIAAACEAAQAAGIDFVKTSTGFHPAGGASVQAVKLMKKHAGPMKVKASGGIRTLDDAKQMIDAGADRLGCSAGVQIVSGHGAAGAGY